MRAWSSRRARCAPAWLGRSVESWGISVCPRIRTETGSWQKCGGVTGDRLCMRRLSHYTRPWRGKVALENRLSEHHTSRAASEGYHRKSM